MRIGIVFGALLLFLFSGHLRAQMISDVQGIVTRKSPTDSRWSLARSGNALHDGDRVRTGPRGANAVRIVYENGNTAVLGPDSILELGKGNQVRLLKGELELKPGGEKQAQFQLVPGKPRTVAASSLWRAEEKDGKITLTELAKTPAWLTGFTEVNTTETMGSLVAKVDGRDVPLTVGYHHVIVEIRDQIARTTIEQSFVNHTDSRTEGVFYFPLPQSASIAGFGMWIAGEYVEADVVEKQRAREIYETILRERRDPALLEWTGGNLFKARVFPIFPHSEKRVKITYTEVLPLQRDGAFRYRYALRSELMRRNPVRDLKVDLRVHSASGIESATCKSHPDLARVDLTKHAAHVQLAEQEYTPRSDFEVVVKPKEPESMVTLVPHRRGEDGYFLASVRVPAFAPRRGGPPDDPPPPAAPSHFVFLADTSGSIDPAQRSAQRQVIEAVLSQLGENDTFSLAVCDVDCLWWKEQAQPVTDRAVAAALAFLDHRVSMGWSDLEKTCANLKEKDFAPGTEIIYLGDGVPATAKTDPNEFARFLTNLIPDSAAIRCHAVATGATFEPVTMEAMASLGRRGTHRQITDSPIETARELLEDILNPGYSEFSIAFGDGLRTARVYPDTFSNVAPGEQRFVVGRYLPGDADQVGTVQVSGRIGGNNIKWTLPMTIPVLESAEGGDTGNSFIPRLWARKHLDVLLEQGSNETIRDEIVSLSEEYKIMTPYTSFLVLESDADRKRFGVKRRFQMRDGERFFSDGREAANFELVAQQMKRAAMWRQQLRQRVLSGMSGMGRQAQFSVQPRHVNFDGFAMVGHGGVSLQGYEASSLVAGNLYRGFDSRESWFGREGEETDLSFGFDFKSDQNEIFDFEETDGFAAADPFAEAPMASSSPISVGYDTDYVFRGARKLSSLDRQSVDALMVPRQGSTRFGRRFFAGKKEARAEFHGQIHSGWETRYPGSYQQSFQFVFPHLPASTAETVSPKTDWSDEVRQLVDSLERDKSFFERPSHLQFTVTSFDRFRAVVTAFTETEFASSGKAGEWIHASANQWSGEDDQFRFVFSEVTGLGRRRKSQDGDKKTWKPVHRACFPDLETRFENYQARLVPAKDRNLQWLVFSTAEKESARFLIDPRRSVILQRDAMHKDGTWKVMEKNSEFVEFRGQQFVKVSETFDFDGKRSSRVEFAIADGDGGLFDEVKTVMKSGIVIGELPTILEAQRNIAAGEATLEDLFLVMEGDFSRQQWKAVEERLGKFSTKADSMRWLWMHFYQMSRQNESLRERLITESTGLARNKDLPTLLRVQRGEKLIQISQYIQAGERLEILDLLEPGFTIPEEEVISRLKDRHWRMMRGYALDQWPGATRSERVQWWKSLWEDYEWDATPVSKLRQCPLESGRTGGRGPTAAGSITTKRSHGVGSYCGRGKPRPPIGQPGKI